MRQTFVLAFALLVTLAALPGNASTPNSGPAPWDSNFPTDRGPAPTAMTHHLKCVITEVLEDRVVKIWDEASESEHLIRVAEEVPITARKKRDFDNRARLAFADLDVGQRVKVSYLTGDGTIVGVKVVGKVDKLPNL